MARLEQIREMLTTDPDSPFLRYALGMELVKTGDIEGGLDTLRQLSVDHPSHVPSYFQRAQILARQGEADEARVVCDLGIEAARLSGDTHALSEMMGFRETLSDL